jgi:hypothetical protein
MGRVKGAPDDHKTKTTKPSFISPDYPVLTNPGTTKSTGADR